MRVLKAHLFVMLDVAVGAPLRAVPEPSVQVLKSRSGPEGREFKKLMDEGADWLFYGKKYIDEHRRHQGDEEFYGKDMRRLGTVDARAPAAAPKAEGSGTGGSRVRLSRDLGLAVVTFWEALTAAGEAGGVDALHARLNAGDNQEQLRQAVEEWGLRWDRVGRITKVLTVQVDTDDLDGFVSSNAVDIGRLFTGDAELERFSRLAAYATDGDLSERRFERMYVRWTDALAVYDKSTSLMDPASMRVVQLVETGILMRRLLRETAFEAEEVMSGIRPWTAPWLARSQTRAEHLRRTMAEADLTTSVAPPTHSVEGERLLAQTLAAFDVPRLRQDVQRALSELDRRLEWQRVRWLAVVAVLVFLANAAIALWK